MKKISEGTLPFQGYQTYYRIVGDMNSGKTPLLALHGGPGMAHDYLDPYSGFAAYRSTRCAVRKES